MQYLDTVTKGAASFVATLLVSAVPAAADFEIPLVDSRGGAADVSIIDYDAIMAFSFVEVFTDNEYIEAPAIFSGPLLRDVVASKSPAADATIAFEALDGYRVEIPMQDALDYRLILALTMNGERMSVREKGPMWLIYPLSDHPELSPAHYNPLQIWQINKIEIQ